MGLGLAIISAALLLAFIAGLGLDSGLIRFLPNADISPFRLINSCLTLTGVTGIILAAVFLAGLPIFSPTMLFIRESLFLGFAFTIFVSIRAMFNLLTPAYVARRRAEYSFVQSVLTGTLRFAILVLLGGGLGAFGIFVS